MTAKAKRQGVTKCGWCIDHQHAACMNSWHADKPCKCDCNREVIND